MDGKMKTPDFVYDSEAMRYEHRFSPFINVSTPPFAPYKQFQVEFVIFRSSLPKLFVHFYVGQRHRAFFFRYVQMSI